MSDQELLRVLMKAKDCKSQQDVAEILGVTLIKTAFAGLTGQHVEKITYNVR